MKIKTVYKCTNCGYKNPKWAGKCPNCGEWNTLEEAEDGKRDPADAAHHQIDPGHGSVEFPIGIVNRIRWYHQCSADMVNEHGNAGNELQRLLGNAAGPDDFFFHNGISHRNASFDGYYIDSPAKRQANHRKFTVAFSGKVVYNTFSVSGCGPVA